MGLVCCTEQTVSYVDALKGAATREEDDDIKPTADAGDLTSAKQEKQEVEWDLPPGGGLTVLMFGMTGAGKSALGNLMANCSHFTSGDDTASVTNLDSVMRYDAPDHSVTILDSIGLGDTEIDQEKVVGSIRDVALSAPNGVDAMLFVMRNARITDDAIARLVYVTECLWGSECLLNLYIVVTFASRYAQSREEANAWIERQVEINWRFKHIYNLVGNNPNRFIFIDNPDSECGEPEIEKRQSMSRTALRKMLCQHPRDVIPPFTHAMMKTAKAMLTEELAEAKQAETEIAQAHEVIIASRPGQKKNSVLGNMKGLFRAGNQQKLSPEEEAKAQEAMEKAKAKKKLADEKLKKALLAVRTDATLQAEATKLADEATKKFSALYESKSPSEGEAAGTTGGLAGAAKRMLKGLWGGKGKQDDKSKTVQKTSGGQDAQSATAGVDKTQDLDAIIAKLQLGHLKETDLCTIFKTRLDFGETDAVPPMIFANFLKELVSDVTAMEIGGLWRRADKNCDGLLSFSEFYSLFSS